MDFFSSVLRLIPGLGNKKAELDPWNDLYYDSGSGIIMSKGATLSSEQAMREATVFACIRIISDGIAQMDLELLNIDDDGNKKQATGNPVYSLLKHKPTTWMSGYDYWKWNLVNLCLRGFFLSRKVYSRDKVVAIIPYHPDYTKFEQAADGSYIFKSVSVQNVAKKRYNAVDTFTQGESYFCMYGTIDGVTPVSPIKYASETIHAAKQMRKHGSKMFDNTAIPPGVLTVPEALDDKAFKRLRESWQAAYGGENAGKVAVLEQGTKFDKISITNEDAQYLETRGYTREEIAAIFGVPPYMVGDTKQAKGWSTIEAQSNDLLRWTFMPWIKRIEDATQIHMIPRSKWGKTEARFNTFEWTRGNLTDRQSYYVSGITNGFLSPNEVRLMENMNKRDGGDEFMTPMNMSVGDEETEEPEVPEEDNNDEVVDDTEE